MTQVRSKNVKYTGVYRCPDEIGNFNIRIKIKEKKDSKRENEADFRVVQFKWQQKKFGRSEKEFYSDRSNCVTDQDKKYHQDVVDLADDDDDDGFLFSYVDDDLYETEEAVVVNSQKSSKLAAEMNKMRNTSANAKITEFDFDSSLNACIQNPAISKRSTDMFVMADFGDYFENTWIKREYQLCSFKYVHDNKTLEVCPDFTTSVAYRVEVHDDNWRTFEYYVENASNSSPDEQLLKEQDVLKKVTLHNLKLKAQNVSGDFQLAPKQKLQVFLFFEILNAKSFTSGNIYVQYSLDLPETWSCDDESSLQGLTQSSVVKSSKNGVAFFGFPFEICLQYNIRELEKSEVPKSPYIYLEVVSKETWHRFRTEGVAYKALPVFQPGLYEYELDCLRIRPKSLSGNLRRFFIGDYMSCTDISWFGLPLNHEEKIINKFGVDTMSTGQLRVRLQVLHQSQALMKDPQDPDAGSYREKFLLEKLNSSGLIKSVEQVLRAFRDARKKMVEARETCK